MHAFCEKKILNNYEVKKLIIGHRKVRLELGIFLMASFLGQSSENVFLSNSVGHLDCGKLCVENLGFTPFVASYLALFFCGALVDPRGLPGTRTLPLSPFFFNFMQFS